MLIIFVGIDKSGKTTLIEKIIKKYSSFIRIHCSVPESKDFGLGETSGILRILKELNGKQNIILDRFYIPAEFVYCNIFRNYQINHEYNKYIRQLHQLHPIFIHMNPHIDLVKEVMRNEGDEYIDLRHVKMIHQRYEREIGFLKEMWGFDVIEIKFDEYMSLDGFLEIPHIRDLFDKQLMNDDNNIDIGEIPHT